MTSPTPPTRAEVALAGHLGDADVARAGLRSDDPTIRGTALGALERLDALDDDTLAAGLRDPSPIVRRRAAEISARHTDVDVVQLLDDPDALVAEMAAWACGERAERRGVDERELDRLIDLAGAHRDALVREAAVAALGAIGDERGLDAILRACDDKPAIRRRAIIALSPFEGDEVDAALDAAKQDKDWQVREAAEELG